MRPGTARIDSDMRGLGAIIGDSGTFATRAWASRLRVRRPSDYLPMFCWARLTAARTGRRRRTCRT